MTSSSDIAQFDAAAEPVTVDPSNVVEAYSRDCVEIFWLAEQTNPKANPARSASRALEHIGADYRTRFLYELVQNACDQIEADGRIRIELVDDGSPFGALYVANSGSGFDVSNFDAIVSLAQSSKSADTSIGNKGIGFKSILAISDFPEVYSKAGSGVKSQAGYSFDGFRFGFADDSWFQELEYEPDRITTLREGIHHLFLPVAIDGEPDTARALVDDGYSTLIRVPLRGPEEREKSIKQIQAFVETDVPVGLFLPMLDRIEVVMPGTSEVIAFTRTRTSEFMVDGQTRAELVQLSDSNEWWVFWAEVDEDRMRNAIADSHLGAAWDNWEEAAQVAVAINADQGFDLKPTAYSFLPLMVDRRRAEPRIRAHIHAPFAVDLNRSDFDRARPINSMLLDSIAGLAARAVCWVAGDGNGFAPPHLTLDLLSWDIDDDGEFRRLLEAFEREALDIVNGAFIPAIGRDGAEYVALAEIWTWPERTRVLVPQLVAELSGDKFLSPTLNESRKALLERLCLRLEECPEIEPGPEQFANWAEAAADRLDRRATPISTWVDFYDDLASLIEVWQASALDGRKILLTSEGLTRAEPHTSGPGRKRLKTVFFPPVEGLDDEETAHQLTAPRGALGRYLKFMDRRLNLHEESRSEVRELLSRFVRRFDATELLGFVGRALRASKVDSIPGDALVYAYQLTQGRKIKGDVIRGVGLKVPTRGGWERASNVSFGEGWNLQGGDALSELFERMRAELAGLETDDLNSAELARSSEWPFPLESISEWREFLLLAGVTEGLMPIEVRAGRKQSLHASTMNPEAMARSLPFDESLRSQWRLEVEKNFEFAIRRPGSTYESISPFWDLPGRSVFEALSSETKRKYSQLVVSSMERWPNDWDVFRWRSRNTQNAQTIDFPSTLKSFLKATAWIPATLASGGSTFRVPLGVWRAAPSSSVEQADLAMCLDSASVDWFESIPSPAVWSQLESLGVHSWASTDFVAEMHDALAGLVADTDAKSANGDLVANLITDFWSTVRAEGAVSDHDFTKGLVVMKGGEPEMIRGRGQSPVTVYLGTVSDKSSNAYELARAAGLARLDLDRTATARTVRTALQNTRIECRGLDEMQITFDASHDHEHEIAVAPPLITADREWLALLIGAILLEKSHGRDQWGRANTVRQVNQVRATRLLVSPPGDILLDGEPLDLPRKYAGAIGIRIGGVPTLVVDPSVNLNSTDGLMRVSPAICELAHRSEYASDLALAIAALEPEKARPDDHRIGDVLDLNQRRIDRVRTLIGIDRNRRELYSQIALIALAGGDYPDRIDRPQRSERTFAELAGEFDQMSEGDQAILSSAVAASTLEELKSAIGISLGQFNAILDGLGIAPLTFRERLEAEHRRFIEEKRIELRDELRRAYFRVFESRGGLEEYVRLRSLSWLYVEREWLVTDENLVTERVWAQFRSKLIPSQVEHEAQIDLEPFEDVRKANLELVGQIARSSQLAIRAWCVKNQKSPPAELDSQLFREELLRQAEESGEMDFRRLAESEVIDRFLDDVWPAGMDRTLELDSLGVTESDLQDADVANQTAADIAKMAERRIEVDGIEFNAGVDGFAEIAAHVREALSGTVPRTIRFEHLPPSAGRTPRRRASAASPRRTTDRRKGKSRKTHDQLSSIGYLGELIAEHYLKSKHTRGGRISWVSANANFEGNLGDDDFGCDFQHVAARKVTYYEVKASEGPSLDFELGLSEVKLAESCVGVASREFRLLRVFSVTSLDNYELVDLPNPVDSQNSGVFTQARSSIKFAVNEDALRS